MSFRLKTILGIALIEGVLLLILVQSSVSILTRSSENETVKRAQTIAGSFVNLTRDAVLSSDLARLDSVAAQALRSPDLMYVRFMNTQHVLAQAGTKDVLGRPFAQDDVLDQVDDGVFDFGADIVEYGDVYGRVEIGLSVARAVDLISDTRQHLLGIALVEMLLVALFSYVLGTYLTRGLKGLTEAAQAISGGALGTRVKLKGTDDLAVAGEAFNTMSLRLAESHRDMQRSIAQSEALAEQLAEKESKLSTILDAAVDGFIIIDEHGVIDDINPAGAALFGYRTAELRGQNVSRLMPAPDRNRHDRYLQNYMKTGKSSIIGVGREVSGLRKDGTTFPLDLSVSEMMVANHRMFVGLVRDVSEQKRIEHEARQNAAMKAAVVEANIDALVTIDLEDRIVEFSSVAEELFGYQRAEVLGQPMAGLLIPREMRERHIQGMNHYKLTGDGPVLGKRIEVEAMRSGGELFPAELTVQPIEVDSVTLFTAFIRDISDRKAAERELRDARQRAEAASEAKSRFVAHMSHEIRSPLNAMLGSVDLLLEHQLTEEQRRYARTAQTSGRTLLALVNDILDFSKIEAGELELDHQVFNLTELLSDAAHLISVLCRERQLQTVVAVDPHVPDYLTGDAARLRQILINLIDNALKFTEAGAVVLAVTQTDEDAETVRLRFTVQDTGIGIAPEAQSRLFDEFQQADSSDSTRYGGTGLGLSICKGLCKAMKGTISVDSELGQGARFWVEIRFEKDAASCEASPPERLPHPTRILIVGLHPIAHQVVTAQLNSSGISARCVTTPAEALSCMNAETDAVLIDASLPPSELTNLSQRTRELGIRRVILLSAKAIPAAADRILERHYDEVIIMPLVVRKLIESLQNQRGYELTSGSAPLGEAQAHQGKGKILLAEDSPANQIVAEAILRKAGYQVDIVDNGRQAIIACMRKRYDLILMDLRMPELNGLEATTRIRALEDEYRTPIVALTANASKQDIERCLEAGMDDFVAKPMDRQKLFQALEHHMVVNNTSAPIGASTASEKPEAEAVSQDAIPLLDPAIVDSLAQDTSPESVPTMLKLFMEEIIKRGDRLRDQLHSMPLESIEDEAHTLKSCAGTFGALRLQQLAQAMEAACREKDRSAAQNLGSEMQTILAQTVQTYVNRFAYLHEYSGYNSEQPTSN